MVADLPLLQALTGWSRFRLAGVAVAALSDAVPEEDRETDCTFADRHSRGIRDLNRDGSEVPGGGLGVSGGDGHGDRHLLDQLTDPGSLNCR